ncbi:MAG: hypothetical protein KKA07_16340 [Bacteroidetes bacterium]|nr:hypothetical protein [Bacteroidota bacterium]MBU1720635.1 hypothetical protein [Bacteroidota bacterium]
MDYVFIITFAVTLVLFSLFERVKKFIYLISLQGVLLFGIALVNLLHIYTLELVFILLETIVVKSVVIPLFLMKMMKHNQLKRVHEVHVPVFYSIVITTFLILGSFLLSSYVNIPKLHTRIFAIGFASLLFGIYFIIIHKNIFSHLIGYLIIENGIFLFSVGIGSQMPVLVGLAILLDILIGILIIGIFVNKVKDRFNSIDIAMLSQLKD